MLLPYNLLSHTHTRSALKTIHCHFAKLRLARCAGTLPSTWGRNGSLPSLQQLTIESTSLTGVLPPQWGSPTTLQYLEVLNIKDSSIDVTLPASWLDTAAFPLLQQLDLSNQRPTKALLPSEQSNSTAQGHSRPFCGSIIQEGNNSQALPCGLWPRLLLLDVTNTSATGTIPETLADSFPAIEVLRVSQNQVTGSLPSSLPPKVGWLDFNYNHLTGSLPAAWSNHSTLATIVLYNNNLTGPLPPTWTCPQLILLTVLSNNLTGSIPPWGESGAMPVLQQLYIGQNKLTGTLPTLPASLQQTITGDNELTGPLPVHRWPPRLLTAEMSLNSHTGSIPAELAAMTKLQTLQIVGNRLTGQIPEAWGQPGVFSDLFALSLDDNLLSGTLHTSWGSQGGLQQLHTLSVAQNNISGALPDSWGTQGAFPALRSLDLEDTAVTGTIPASWTSAEAFRQLQSLDLDYTYLQGSLPPFNNINLEFLSLSHCSFAADLGLFWGSTAPLSVVSLANNSLFGSLPDVTQALDRLSFFDVSANNLQGTMPLSWLKADGMLSHISYMDVGQVWRQSRSMLSWRQQLCLHQEFYSPDVTGLQIANLPAVLRALLGQEIGSTTDEDTWKNGFVQNSEALLFVSLLQHGHNQLTAVPSICANGDAGKVLLILWLTFGACCAKILGIYALFHRYSGRSNSTPGAGFLHGLPVRFLKGVLHQIFSGLGGLAFYYYDLVASIIVLVEVWGTWPGEILAAIFLVHFAVVGFVVAFQALSSRRHRGGVRSKHSQRLDVLLVFWCSLLCSPILIPVVILLDTAAFIRQIILCVKDITGRHGLKCMRSCHLVARRSSHDCRCNLKAPIVLCLSWVDLESYEDMHNLVVAFLQSLPTVVLNSIIFSLGNKPSHCIFLSSSLFVAAIIASCLVIMKCLIVALFQAYNSRSHPLMHIATKMSGKNLVIVPQVTQTAPKVVEILIMNCKSAASPPLGMPDCV